MLCSEYTYTYAYYISTARLEKLVLGGKELRGLIEHSQEGRRKERGSAIIKVYVYARIYPTYLPNSWQD